MVRILMWLLYLLHQHMHCSRNRHRSHAFQGKPIALTWSREPCMLIQLKQGLCSARMLSLRKSPDADVLAGVTINCSLKLSVDARCVL